MAMNRTDEVKFVWHRRQLPANGRQGNKKSVIMHGTNFEFKAARLTMDFQRTVSCELTGCLTLGVHRIAQLHIVDHSLTEWRHGMLL